VLIGALHYGTCTIQPTKIAFSSNELFHMVQKCGLNKLNQFATFLATHLRGSRDNSKLLDLLRGLDEINYSGLPLQREEEEWAYKNNMRLRVRIKLGNIEIVLISFYHLNRVSSGAPSARPCCCRREATTHQLRYLFPSTPPRISSFPRQRKVPQGRLKLVAKP